MGNTLLPLLTPNGSKGLFWNPGPYYYEPNSEIQRKLFLVPLETLSFPFSKNFIFSWYITEMYKCHIQEYDIEMDIYSSFFESRPESGQQLEDSSPVGHSLGQHGSSGLSSNSEAARRPALTIKSAGMAS